MKALTLALLIIAGLLATGASAGAATAVSAYSAEYRQAVVAHDNLAPQVMPRGETGPIPSERAFDWTPFGVFGGLAMLVAAGYLRYARRRPA